MRKPRKLKRVVCDMKAVAVGWWLMRAELSQLKVVRRAPCGVPLSWLHGCHGDEVTEYPGFLFEFYVGAS